MDKNFDITWVSLWRIVGMLLLVSVFYIALDVWIAVLLAVVVSSALDPSVSWLEKKRIPRVVGAVGVFAIFIGLVTMVLYTVIPIAVSEFNILLKNIGEFGPVLRFQEVSNILTSINESLGEFANIFLSGSASFFDVITAFIGGLALAASSFILAFYLTVDRDGVENFLRDVIPKTYEEIILDIYFKTRKKIGKWLYGQMFLSLSIGLAAFIGLWFLGVKYSLLLGILAGAMEIVPYAGPILSGVIAVLIGAAQSPSIALYVFILFIIIQQLEGNFLTPVFMKMATSLHPAAVLVALLIGGKLLGVVGIILSVPLAVMAQVLVDEWSINKRHKKELTS
ncbi:AI-2E family transporter [Candidatus Wolfebacteria bacterium]|nr:AI-2E family transporter [Candidatus Wolfebacteria bacterium]